MASMPWRNAGSISLPSWVPVANRLFTKSRRLFAAVSVRAANSFSIEPAYRVASVAVFITRR